MVQDLAKQRAAEASWNLTGRAGKYKALRREAAREAVEQLEADRKSLEGYRAEMKLHQMLTPYNLAPCPPLPPASERNARRAGTAAAPASLEGVKVMTSLRDGQTSLIR
eukprot:TRINITY_DN115364_c0_g1_i1.p2 TRINITY_DN115364_c0_g1~~TRINITY_DN115364_c0_g1_i1.p2  ORF type:complete len:109 (+),score=27.03 TRINITY_DN115364_c0_g1_i1:53-379(+)